MPKELFAILLTANLGVLGASATAAPAKADADAATKSAAVQQAGTYEKLSWDEIGGGRAQRGSWPEVNGNCGG